MQLPPPSLTWQVAQLTCRYDLTRASSEAPRLVGVNQSRLVVAPSGQRAMEHADVLECAELVVDGAAVVAVAIELEWSEARDEAGRSRVADETLCTGGESPVLLATAARRARIGHLERLADAAGANQLGVGLLGVPAVRVTGPFPLLPNQKSRLDSLAGRLQGVVKSVKAERLNQNRAVRQRPRAARVELGLLLDPLQARQGGEPLDRRPVGPLRRIDVIDECGRVWLVVGDRGKQARSGSAWSGTAERAGRPRSSARGDRTRSPGQSRTARRRGRCRSR